MDKKKSRILIVVSVFLMSVSLMTLKLIDIQIVNGVWTPSEDITLRTLTVKGARGEIFDRNGVKLVSNKPIYSVTFDGYMWDKENQNEIILKTCRLLENFSIKYEDSLPISMPPYEFLDEQTNINRLNKLLSSDGVTAMTADDVIKYLTDRYKISKNMSKADARTVAGVRYDMERKNFSKLNPFTLVSDIPMDVVMTLRERESEYRGVTVAVSSVRSVETPYAAHILGRTGPIYREDYDKYKSLGYPMDATVGIDGMEQVLEEYLKGTDGEATVEKNLSGKTVNIREKVPAVSGADCYLTIDIKLQEAAEKSLASNIERIRATSESEGETAQVEGGAAVVIEVGTGDILACASYPTFDLSTFSADYSSLLSDPLRPMLNRAIQGLYAPGSVFKMVTATATLEEGIITPDTKIYDEGVYRYYAPDYLYRCWYYKDHGKSHGDINVSQALAESCNYFFYETARLLGIDKLNEYTAMFGLGEKTGIELPGESAGIVAGPKMRQEKGLSWYPGETLTASIGQSDNQFTPIQLANYMATVASGGVRYNTHLTDKIVRDGALLYEPKREPVSVIGYEKENLEAIINGMKKVTEDGTAGHVFKDYPVAVLGKTGSAQLGEGSANGVFVLAAPADDPTIAVAVVVEHAGSGNNVAWIARDIVSAYFQIDF